MHKKTIGFSLFCVAALAATLFAACGGPAQSAPEAPAPASSSAPASNTPEPAPRPDVPAPDEDGDEGQPGASEMDMLVHGGFIYMRGDTYPGMDPVDVSTLTKGEEALKITSNDAAEGTSAGYASLLPVGTPVYAVESEPAFLLAELEGEDVLYVKVMAAS